LVSIGLWLHAKSSFTVIWVSPWLFVAQGFGILAITLISLNFALTTRWRIFEKLLGGLPEVYIAHKILGTTGILCGVLHLSFLLLHAYSYPSLYNLYLLPSTYWSLDYAKIALALFIILGIMAASRKIKYDLWKYYHKYMGLAFLFAALHVLTINSDVYKDELLRTWISILMGIGFFTFFYTKSLYKYIGPRYKYVVSDIEKLKGKVNVISMVPAKRRRIRYQPAQFVYVSFRSKEVHEEDHPFTIVSSTDDLTLKISPKEIGDYTSTLKNLKVSSEVVVWGPYGNYGDAFLKDNRDQIWIAGGIGVTPFISMMAYQKNHPKQAKKWFFYCTRASEDASYEEHVRAETKELGITLIQHYSNEKGYLTADYIKEHVPDIHDKVILLCGPPRMMAKIIKQLIKAGVKRSDIIFERFSM
jgi:predicted ferric reductase